MRESTRRPPKPPTIRITWAQSPTGTTNKVVLAVPGVTGKSWGMLLRVAAGLMEELGARGDVLVVPDFASGQFAVSLIVTCDRDAALDVAEMLRASAERESEVRSCHGTGIRMFVVEVAS